MNGRLVLRAGVRNGRTVLLESAGTFPLQVMRPQVVLQAVHPPVGPERSERSDAGSGISLVLLLSGGLLDGDSASIEVVVEPGARLALRTQAATQVHAGRSRQTLRAQVGEHAWLSYLPHALVPHADADYHGQTVVEMQTSSRVLVAEALSPGRIRFGEQFAFRRVRLDLDVRRELALIARERVLVQPDLAVQTAQFGAATHTAGIFMLGRGEPMLDWACGTALVGRSQLASGGWYIRAAADRAATLDNVLRQIHTGWNAQ